MKMMFASLALAALVTAPLANAQSPWSSTFNPRGDQAKERSETNAPRAAAILPPGQILQMLASRDKGGIHRGIQKTEIDGKPIYIVDWVTGRGEFVRYLIDAQTGRVVSAG